MESTVSETDVRDIVDLESSSNSGQEVGDIVDLKSSSTSEEEVGDMVSLSMKLEVDRIVATDTVDMVSASSF